MKNLIAMSVALMGVALGKFMVAESASAACVFLVTAILFAFLCALDRTRSEERALWQKEVEGFQKRLLSLENKVSMLDSVGVF